MCVCVCVNVLVCLDREEPMAAASCGLQENRAVKKLASLLSFPSTHKACFFCLPQSEVQHGSGLSTSWLSS